MAVLDYKESWVHLVLVVHLVKKERLVHLEDLGQLVHQDPQENLWDMMQQQLQLFLDKDKVKDLIHYKAMILIFQQEYLAKKLLMMIGRNLSLRLMNN